MWPVGTYARMVHDIKRREEPSIPVTFGVLIADYRQQKAREYVLNYIARFDRISWKYINFYLPGYLETKESRHHAGVKVRGTNYVFDEDVYIEFLDSFCSDFEIDFPYNPVLVLLEYDRGHFRNTRKIVIELDADGSQIEHTGRLIETIVGIAKAHVELDEFSTNLQRHVVKNSLLERIIESTDNALISAIAKGINDTQKYKIV